MGSGDDASPIERIRWQILARNFMQLVSIKHLPDIFCARFHKAWYVLAAHRIIIHVYSIRGFMGGTCTAKVGYNALVPSCQLLDELLCLLAHITRPGS